MSASDDVLGSACPGVDASLIEVVGQTQVVWGTRTDNNQEINRDYHWDEY